MIGLLYSGYLEPENKRDRKSVDRFMIEKIMKELEARYSCSLVRLAGGYTNLTFLMEGTSPVLVAKVANLSNHDILNEINSLMLIEGLCPAPVILDVVEMNDMRIMVMDYKDGVNGQSILDARDLELAEILYKGIGQLLALQIHSTSFDENPRGIRKSNIATLLESNLLLDFVDDELIKQSIEILSAVDVNKQNWVLTHGDYGLHNILSDEDYNMNVIDWEWSEWGDPINDIAWVCWFTKLHYPEHAHFLNTHFIKSYLLNNPIAITRQQLKASCIYKVWNILYRVDHATKEVQNEWVRRLEWTLHLDFSDLC